MMRTMLQGADLSSEYWTYAIRHAVYLFNRIPRRSLHNFITPFEKFTSHKPDLVISTCLVAMSLLSNMATEEPSSQMTIQQQVYS